jgi:mono/diheme cytochrome c family protein
VKKERKFTKRSVPSVMVIREMGRGLHQQVNPKPTNFRDSHGEKMTDGEHFWEIATGRGGMPSFAKDLTEEGRWQVINYINTFNKRP